jgi:rubrerythrin
MTGILRGNDLVETAIQIEKNGAAFYDEMAQSAKEESVREKASFFAGEERKHLKIFQEMLASVGEPQPVETYPGEYMLYVRTLADQHIFTKEKDAQEQARKAASDIEAIDFALGIERDSILFYSEIKNFIRKGTHEAVDRIIEEERKHLIQFAELKKQISGG